MNVGMPLFYDFVSFLLWLTLTFETHQYGLGGLVAHTAFSIFGQLKCTHQTTFYLISKNMKLNQLCKSESTILLERI